MQLAAHEQRRARDDASGLSRHYRSIGCAAILAALMFQPQRTRKAV